MSYKIKLENFSGPFDLLLHLVSESKMDLLDLNLGELTEQYLSYVKQAQELDFDEASEYLVMASQLLNMKTKILLPIEKNDSLDFDYDKNSPELLIKRLMEYKKIRSNIDLLRDSEAERLMMLRKLESSMIEFIDDSAKIENDGSHQVDLLSLMLEQAIKRKQLSREITTHIKKDEVSYEIVQENIHNKLNSANADFYFEDFIEMVSIKYIVTVFFVLLSLTSMQEIHIIQDDNFGEIKIRKGAFSA